MQQLQQSQQTTTAPASGGGFDWMNIGGGALAGAPLGPIGMVAGAGLSAIGSYMDAQAEEKQRKIENKRANRQLGMNALAFMKDDLATALVRSRRGM
jgi:hypothetical protein